MPLITTFSAPDIQCDGCARSIQKSLAQAPGIGDVTVDIAAKTVTVTHDAAVADVTAALDDAGFPATVTASG
jgi:copper chaperone CopZ